ncbi:MAG: TRAP transporter large permease subunit, partial [Syntrophomonadaceae bacterium]|nr:TRAP transporter large permease subunit [Syntrophomonadaceae bacterium]
GLPVHEVWLATLVPGILVATAYILYNRIFMAKYEIHDTSPFDAKKFFGGIAKTTPKGLVALIMPLIIFVGVYGGIMTPTEAGAVAVLYGLIAGWILYPLFFKEKSVGNLWEISKKSLVTTASICLLIAFSGIPSTLFTYGQVTKALTDALLGISSSPIAFLIAVNVMLLFVGMFMETNTAILLFAPILVPAAVAYGIDPIHFAAIMLLNLEMGMITPPMASNIFVACKISNLTMDKILAPILKLWACCIPVLLATTFIPSLSLVIINLLR